MRCLRLGLQIINGLITSQIAIIITGYLTGQGCGRVSKTGIAVYHDSMLVCVPLFNFNSDRVIPTLSTTLYPIPIPPTNTLVIIHVFVNGLFEKRFELLTGKTKCRRNGLLIEGHIDNTGGSLGNFAEDLVDISLQNDPIPIRRRGQGIPAIYNFVEGKSSSVVMFQKGALIQLRSTRQWLWEDTLGIRPMSQKRYRGHRRAATRSAQQHPPHRPSDRDWHETL